MQQGDRDLEDSIEDVLGKTGGQVGQADAWKKTVVSVLLLSRILRFPTYSHSYGTREAEADIAPDERLLGEVALGDAEAEAEGHDGLVQHDGHEDGDEAARVALEADGETVEDGVEGEGEEEHDGAEAGVLENAVGDVVVAVVAVVGVVDLATDPHHHSAGLVAVVVVPVVMAVVGVAVVVVVVVPAVGAAEQGLVLALGGPLLLVVQHCLLNCHD